MIHDRVDIARWRRLFPLSELRKEARRFVGGRRKKYPKEYPNAAAVERHVKLMSPSGEIITSPYHLAVVEQLRDEVLSRNDLEKIQTDVFILSKGEPTNRAVTKIGGLPLWPRDRTWPSNRKGEPLSFLAQICFADSLDFVGKLPSDVLLIFADGVYGSDWSDDDREALWFEWISSKVTRLVSRRELPPNRWPLTPFFGCIHRTVDYPDAGRDLDKSLNQPWCITVLEGTKIGGCPSWIQNEENVRGRFLCTLGSIQPKNGKPYPYVNAAEPLPLWAFGTASEEGQILIWGDVGSLYLFLRKNGSIGWTIQSY